MSHIKVSSRLAWSLFLTLGFVFFEIAAGIWANSLALLTDAAHNFTDVIALGLSWYAVVLASRPPNARRTFGYHRAGILVALVNSTSLTLISIGIFWEAYKRLLHPLQVHADVMAGVGAIAFVVNITTAWLVHKGSDQDLNLRSTFVHLMGDVFSTLGAALAGIVIWSTGFNWLDPLVSFLIGILILWNAWRILRETIGILLENTPGDINVNLLVSDLLQVEGVFGVHDLHVWSLTQSLRALSAHIVIKDAMISSGCEIRKKMMLVLQGKYGISHSTLQFECADCDTNGLHCDLNEIVMELSKDKEEV